MAADVRRMRSSRGKSGAPQPRTELPQAPFAPSRRRCDASDDVRARTSGRELVLRTNFARMRAGAADEGGGSA